MAREIHPSTSRPITVVLTVLKSTLPCSWWKKDQCLLPKVQFYISTRSLGESYAESWVGWVASLAPDWFPGARLLLQNLLRLSRLGPFLCVTRLCSTGYATMRSTSVRATRRCKWFRRRQVLKARRPGAFTLPLAWQDIYGLANLKCSCQSWIDATFADTFSRPKIMYGFCKGIDGIDKLRHGNWVKNKHRFEYWRSGGKRVVQLSIWILVEKKLIYCFLIEDFEVCGLDEDLSINDLLWLKVWIQRCLSIGILKEPLPGVSTD